MSKPAPWPAACGITVSAGIIESGTGVTVQMPPRGIMRKHDISLDAIAYGRGHEIDGDTCVGGVLKYNHNIPI